MKRRLLFVDDEPRVLQGLRRMLRGMRSEWDMVFAEGGQSALTFLKSDTYDVVVSDIRMPGLDGIQLLTEIMHRYPHTIRIALSGHAEEESILRTIGPVHEYLSKPCNAHHLRETITRMCALQKVLEADSLKEVMASLATVPNLPNLYGRALQETHDPHTSLSALADIIGENEALSSQVRWLARAVAASPIQAPTHLKHACQQLGFNLTAKFILAYQGFRQFERGSSKGLKPEELWTQSLRIGLLAREISLTEGCDPIFGIDALIGGLLRDLGRLVLSQDLGTAHRLLPDMVETKESNLAAERDAIGATHAEVGGYLLGFWGIPAVIVEAATYHHQPSEHRARTFSPVTAVYAAGVMHAILLSEHDRCQSIDELDIECSYFESLQLADRLPFWRDRCRAALARYDGLKLEDNRRWA